MLFYLLGGAIGLAALLGLIRLLAVARPETLARVLRYVIGGGLVLIGGLLSTRGFALLGVPVAAAGVGALARGRIGNFSLIGTRLALGRTSEVRSAYLAMRLDHDSGALAGEVVAGKFAGQGLDGLAIDALRELHSEVAHDPDSVALLEAYLDRRQPGWRENLEDDAAAGPAGAPDPGAMTDEQAYQILGLLPGAAEAEIRAAHRRLMMRVHPDQGGSTFLAAQINRAKDRLLGKHR